MTNDDRLLGRLQEFMDTTKKDLSEIKHCLEDLKAFKWKVTGMATAASVVVSVLMKVVFKQ